MTHNTFNIQFVLSLLALIGLACGAATNAKPAAELAIENFHKSFDSDQIAEIYRGSHSNFKAATTEDDFNKLMVAVNQKLGKVKSTNTQNWNVKSFNLRTTIVMVQNTEFERGNGTETFTFDIDNERAILLGYNIASVDLITK